MKHTISVALALAACGDTPGPIADARPDVSLPDAAGDGSIADRWSSAEPIAELASAADERFGSPAAGGRFLYLTRTEMIGSFIVNVPYVATRASVDDDYGAPARPVAWGSSSIHDQDHRLDHLEWFFWRGLGKLGRAARDSITDPWSFPEDLGIDGFSPSISGDGLSLYFIDRSGRLAVARRADLGADFGPPAPVSLGGELTIDAIDISADELTLLITADPRTPESGVYRATRSSLEQGFGEPRPLASLTGPFESARLGPDEHEIVVSLELGGDRNLYRSHLIEEQP